MFETKLTSVRQTLADAGLRSLAFGKRVSRVVARGVIRKNISHGWSGRIRKEDVQSGELVVFCLLLIGCAFAVVVAVGAVAEIVAETWKN